MTRVCSLLRDFNQLPNGDMTIIGDHGEPLSGGQKAKVNLARAIYRQADLYLLDDPLSAIDASVARLIFKECILKFLQGKTRILVTNQLYCLKEAHTIALFERVTLLTIIYILQEIAQEKSYPSSNLKEVLCKSES